MMIVKHFTFFSRFIFLRGFKKIKTLIGIVMKNIVCIISVV